jgi:hypothetical protein
MKGKQKLAQKEEKPPTYNISKPILSGQLQEPHGVTASNLME